jgi:hypothetical protein
VGEDDVVLRDLEAGIVVGGGDGGGEGRGKRGTTVVLEVEDAARSVSSSSDERTAGEHDGVEVAHKPWMRNSDAGSQEDLGREMTARSMG